MANAFLHGIGSGKPKQEKQITITENGTIEILPDDGKVLSKVSATANVQLPLQEKTVADNGSVTPDEGYYGLSSVSVDVQPALQDKEIIGEGTVTPDEGYYGLSSVEVAVPLQEKTVEENSTVTPDEGYYALGSVSVDVQPALQEKIATDNGEITPDEGYYGLNLVTVDLLHTSTDVHQLIDGTGTGDFIIPDGTTRIAPNIFKGQGYSSVTIPVSVTSIGKNAFANCANLTTIYYAGTRAEWTANLTLADNWIDKTEYDVICSDGAFAASGLVYVLNEAPATYSLRRSAGASSYSVASVGICTESDVEVPATYNNLPVIGICDGAFADYTALTSIALPSTTTSVGASAFEGCTGLTTVYYDGTYEDWNVNVVCADGWTDQTFDIVCSDGVIGSNGIIYALNESVATMSLEDEGETSSISYSVASVGTCVESSIEIPATVNNAPVTGIWDEAFADDTLLTSIVIPEGIVDVGAGAFSGCTNLVDIELPSTLTYISDNMFYGCTKLANLPSLEYITTIGEEAFRSCTSLKVVIIPDNVINLGASSFYDCPLVEVDTGNGGSNRSLTSAFNFTTTKTIEKVTIGNGYTSVPSSAFYQCESLKEAHLSDYIVSIGQYAFAYCRKLKNFNLPNGLGRIEADAFRNCERLVTITLPSTLYSIGDYAFYQCYNLLEVVNHSSISDNMQSNMSGNTFNGCVCMYATSVHTDAQSRIETINGCKFLLGDTSPKTGVKNADYLVSCDVEADEIVIPDDYKGNGYSILKYAFEDAKCTSITMPNATKSYPADAFLGCTNLQEVHVNNLTSWCNSSFVGTTSNPLYYAKHLYANDELITSLILPEDTAIPAYAFYNCKDLMSVTIPSVTTSIGTDAFYGCTKLSEVVNNSSLTITAGATTNGYIGYYAFSVHTGESNIATNGDYLFLTASDGSSCLIGYTGHDTELILPETYNDGAYSIGSYAFAYNPDITCISIPNGVINISEGSFCGCDNLIDIVIPDSVTSIGSYAFQNCTSLRSANIPENVVSIGSYAFSKCSSLENIYYNASSMNNLTSSSLVFSSAGNSTTGLTVTFGENVTKLPNYLFYNCTNLKQINYNATTVANLSSSNYVFYNAGKNTDGIVVNVGENVTCIPEYLFYPYSNNTYAPNIVSVIFAENSQCTSIGKSAFYYCYNLRSIVIPDSVASIGSYAFYYCTNLQNLSIGSGVTNIENYSFRNCSNLRSIVIPDSVKSIGNSAFYACEKLVSVTLGSGVTSIYSDAFRACNNLAEVINHSSLTLTIGSTGNGYVAYYASVIHSDEQSRIDTIGNYQFVYDDTTNYLINYIGYDAKLRLPETYKGEAYDIGSHAFTSNSDLTEIIIPNTVTSIGSYAFSSCRGLTSVTIPKSISNIYSGAFTYCEKLTTVHIFDMSAWCSINFADAKASPLYYAENLYLNNKSVSGNLIIPEGVTSIGIGAFYGLTSLTSVTIPDSVTSIGSYAFQNCTGLTSVTIGNGVTSIGNYAFYNCTGLNEINYNAISVANLAESNYVFYDAGKNGSGIIVTIGANVASIPAYLFCPYSGNSGYRPRITNVVFEDGSQCTSIGQRAFYYCIDLKSIIIPDSVNSIGGYAFESCGGLTSVTLGNGVKSIGYDAFAWCYGLAEVVNHSSLTLTIGSANYGRVACYASVIHNDEQSRIVTYGDYKFISDDTTNYLIGYVGSDVKLSLPEKYNEELYCIGKSVFRNCSLISVTIPDGVTSIGDQAFWNCRSLKSITIGNNVTSIGSSTFYYCIGLTSITIPDSVSIIGSAAFDYCNNLTSITIPDSVTSIGDYAFRYCSGLTSITIGNGVTSIGNYAFEYCRGFTSVTIPDSVTSIGNYAFYSCTGLTLVDFRTATAVPTLNKSGAFSSVSATCKIVVPDSLYDSWIAATNWSTYASYIVKASEYTAA